MPISSAMNILLSKNVRFQRASISHYYTGSSKRMERSPTSTTMYLHFLGLPSCLPMRSDTTVPPKLLSRFPVYEVTTVHMPLRTQKHIASDSLCGNHVECCAFQFPNPCSTQT